MKITKQVKEGVCRAMKCNEAPVEEFEDGVALCARHAKQYDPSPVQSGGSDLVPSKAAVEQDIEHAVEHAEVLLEELPSFTITSEKRLKKASAVLLETKRLAKELEEQRTSVTKPLLEIKRRVDSWFTPTVKMLGEGETKLKALISDYMKDQHEERRQALSEGDHSIEEPTLPAGLQARRKDRTKLVDIDLVPEEYLKPREVDWAKVIDAYRKGEDIPGVEVEPDYSIAVVG